MSDTRGLFLYPNLSNPWILGTLKRNSLMGSGQLEARNTSNHSKETTYQSNIARKGIVRVRYSFKEGIFELVERSGARGLQI